MEIILLKAVSCRRCGRIFISAGAVGEGRPIVLILVDGIPSEKHTVWHSKDIAKLQTAKRPIDKQKEGEECGIQKKPWMTPLPYLLWSMIEYLKITRLSFLVAIFAGQKVSLWNIFPDGDMGDGIREPISSHSDILEENMINRKPLVCDRIRKIDGSFAWISHRFLRSGFFTSLTQNELLLYLFLLLVADRQGLSYYHYDKICSLLCLSVDDYIFVRDQLIDKDLIAFDGTFFQVLSLPRTPVIQSTKLLQNREDMERSDPATIEQIFNKQFSRSHES